MSCNNFLFADFFTLLRAIFTIALYVNIFLIIKYYSNYLWITCKLNFLQKCFYTNLSYDDIVSNLFIGDNVQLQSFTATPQKMQLMPSIFHLAISKPMKHFIIHGQYRSNDNYQAFLGNLLHVLLHYIVYLKTYTNKSISSSNTLYPPF